MARKVTLVVALFDPKFWEGGEVPRGNGDTKTRQLALPLALQNPSHLVKRSLPNIGPIPSKQRIVLCLLRLTRGRKF